MFTKNFFRNVIVFTGILAVGITILIITNERGTPQVSSPLYSEGYVDS